MGRYHVLHITNPSHALHHDLNFLRRIKMIRGKGNISITPRGTKDHTPVSILEDLVKEREGNQEMCAVDSQWGGGLGVGR